MNQRILIALLLVSLGLGFLHIGRGLYLLGASPSQPLDFSLRWAEQMDVAKGINPYDVSEFRFQRMQGTPDDGAQSHLESANIRTWIGSGYPPWAFLWANLFIPPVGIRWSRLWFLAANLLSLGILAGFAWRAIEGGTFLQRTVACTTVLSISSIGTTMGNGQWGLILMALLTGAAVLSERARGCPSGIFLAVALLKPTFSFSFANVHLSRREWLPLTVAAALTACAGIWVAWHVGSGPFAMLGQMLEQSARWKDDSYSIPDALLALGLIRTPVIFVCLAAGGLMAWWFARQYPGDTLFAMAAAGVLARVMTYHQLYDNVLIAFLLLAWVRAYIRRPEWMELAMTTSVLFTLWLPGRFTHLIAVQALQIAVWCLALGCLAYRQRSREHSAPVC